MSNMVPKIEYLVAALAGLVLVAAVYLGGSYSSPGAGCGGEACGTEEQQ